MMYPSAVAKIQYPVPLPCSPKALSVPEETPNHLVKRFVAIFGLLFRGSMAGNNHRAKNDVQNYQWMAWREMALPSN